MVRSDGGCGARFRSSGRPLSLGQVGSPTAHHWISDLVGLASCALAGQSLVWEVCLRSTDLRSSALLRFENEARGSSQACCERNPASLNAEIKAARATRSRSR